MLSEYEIIVSAGIFMLRLRYIRGAAAMNYVENGDFEWGNHAGWYAHYAIVGTKINKFTNKQKRDLNWDDVADGQPMPMVVDGAALLPRQNAPIAPYEGTKMLRINDLMGDQHVTCVHQTVTLPDDFTGSCAFVQFNWGAMLGGSGHTNPMNRPKFSFHVNRKRGKTWKPILTREYVAPQTAADGWIDIRAPGEIDAIWYQAGLEKLALPDLVAGDQIRLRFVAEDCTDGGHGGAAFIDNVILTNGCDGTGASQPITMDALPIVFTPNDDGINDHWGISNLNGACSLELTIFDRWGDGVFYCRLTSVDGTWPAFLDIWNGFIRSKRKAKGNGKNRRYSTRKIRSNDMSSNVVFFKLKLKNCHEARTDAGALHVY